MKKIRTSQDNSGCLIISLALGSLFIIAFIVDPSWLAGVMASFFILIALISISVKKTSKEDPSNADNDYEVHSYIKPGDINTTDSNEHMMFNHITPKLPVSLSLQKQSKIVSIFTNKWRLAAKKEFIVIDIETTGLSKGYDKIIEIAAIRYIKGVETNKFVSLINPGIHIPNEATAVNRITDSMVKNCPTIDITLPQALEFLGDSLLVAHNANFDIGFIEIEARKLGFNPIWNYVDTVSVAKKAIPGLKNYKQQTILDALGYKQQTYHRAEDDCRGCAEIINTVLNSMVE